MKSWLIYWGARMQQIACSFPRPGIQVCLAETVHAAWRKLGMTQMSLGAAVIFDLSTTLRSQVVFKIAKSHITLSGKSTS